MPNVKISALPVASSMASTDVVAGDTGIGGTPVTKQIAKSLLAGASGSAYSTAVLADSPTWYYRCQDLSGTVATDSSGNSHNGTYTNTPLFGHATLCGDTSDYAIHSGVASGQVGITTPTLPSTSAFTIEGIFKRTQNPGDTHNDRLFATDLFGASAGFALAHNHVGGFYINFAVATSGSLNTVQVAPWYWIGYERAHVALVYTGSLIILYVNGAAIYTSPAMTGAYVPSGTYSSVFLGQDPSSNECFLGAMDELALYSSTALSASRIRAHASAMWTQ